MADELLREWTWGVLFYCIIIFYGIDFVIIVGMSSYRKVIIFRIDGRDIGGFVFVDYV